MERLDRTNNYKQDGRPAERVWFRRHQPEGGRLGEGELFDLCLYSWYTLLLWVPIFLKLQREICLGALAEVYGCTTNQIVPFVVWVWQICSPAKRRNLDGSSWGATVLSWKLNLSYNRRSYYCPHSLWSQNSPSLFVFFIFKFRALWIKFFLFIISARQSRATTAWIKCGKRSVLKLSWQTQEYSHCRLFHTLPAALRDVSPRKDFYVLVWRKSQHFCTEYPVLCVLFPSFLLRTLISIYSVFSLLFSPDPHHIKLTWVNGSLMFYQSYRSYIWLFSSPQIGVWNSQNGLNLTENNKDSSTNVTDSMANRTLIVTTILVRTKVIKVSHL